jgi:phage terminase Nu1 subunit (DNA packaging protein)
MSTAVRALTVGGVEEGMLDPAQERARKDRALAEQTEMKNAERRGELVEIEEVGVAVEREFSVVRERSLSITGKLCDKLSPEQLRWVEDEIREALSDLSCGADIEPVQQARARGAKAGKL